MIDEKIFSLIERHHSLKIEDVAENVRISGVKVDALATAYTLARRLARTVAFIDGDEMVEKAVNIAEKISGRTSYTYIVYNLPVHVIVAVFFEKKHLIDKVVRNGIGVISYVRKPVLVMYSRQATGKGRITEYLKQY